MDLIRKSECYVVVASMYTVACIIALFTKPASFFAPSIVVIAMLTLMNKEGYLLRTKDILNYCGLISVVFGVSAFLIAFYFEMLYGMIASGLVTIFSILIWRADRHRSYYEV